MPYEPDLAAIAALIGDPTRAAMLAALLGGMTLPASELATRAGITPQTASAHLAKLLEGDLIRVTRSGRYRYYALRDHQIARLLETLQTLAPLPTVAPPRTANISPALCRARTCYDHLAGKLGVAVTDAWVARGYLIENEASYDLTDIGAGLLEDWDIDVVNLRQKQRKFAYPCLDWSERRFHLAGAVGAAVADHFLSADWVRRRPHDRSLLVTAAGELALFDQLGVRLPLAEST